MDFVEAIKDASPKEGFVQIDADTVPPAGWEAPEGWEQGDPVRLETTLGRALLNEALPVD